MKKVRATDLEEGRLYRILGFNQYDAYQNSTTGKSITGFIGTVRPSQASGGRFRNITKDEFGCVCIFKALEIYKSKIDYPKLFGDGILFVAVHLEEVE